VANSAHRPRAHATAVTTAAGGGVARIIPAASLRCPRRSHCSCRSGRDDHGGPAL
jgi:hypothetical protein